MTFLFLIISQFRNKHRKKSGASFTITQYLTEKNLELECIDWLKTYYPLEGRSSKENTRTHIQYIEHCINKRRQNLGVWDDSPRFFYDTFNTLMSKSMEHAVHPTEDRYFNVREMMHLMGLPHDFEIDSIKSINHIAQVRYIHTTY